MTEKREVPDSNVKREFMNLIDQYVKDEETKVLLIGLPEDMMILALECRSFKDLPASFFPKDSVGYSKEKIALFNLINEKARCRGRRAAHQRKKARAALRAQSSLEEAFDLDSRNN